MLVDGRVSGSNRGIGVATNYDGAGWCVDSCLLGRRRRAVRHHRKSGGINFWVMIHPFTSHTAFCESADNSLLDRGARRGCV